MASDFVAIGVMDGPSANVTEWSTHLSFTGGQVVDRLFTVFIRRAIQVFLGYSTGKGSVSSLMTARLLILELCMEMYSNLGA